MNPIKAIAMASTIASIGLLTSLANNAYAAECAPVTFAEVTYNQGGQPTTQKVRLEASAAADPEQALMSFQRTVNHFGQANVISSRVLTEIACFQQDSAQLKMLREGGRRIQGISPATPRLCADSNGVYECDDLAPDNSYPYSNQDSCSVTNRTGFVSYACPDSGIIVTREGDVVLSVNANNIRAEVLARTEALRRAVGSEDLLTNFHFDIFISPEHQAAVVGNEAFNDIARQLRTAADMGQPPPNVQDLLDALPQPPQNVEFFKQLKEAHARRQQRLEILAHLSNGNRLSPQQLEAFHRDFIGKSQLLDRLIIENTVASLTQAADAINATIQQLGLADPNSTVYEQLKAGARAVLEAHTNQGIFDPEGRFPITPPGDRFLTDEDLEKRLMNAEQLISFNEAIRGSSAETYAAMTAPVFGLLLLLMEDNMDQAWRVYDKLDSLEFFIENDDPTGTRFDVHLNENAQAMFGIDVEPTSSAAYDVTVLLNEVADYHQATGKVTVDYHAIIMVNARAALSTADAIRQLYHTEEAYTWFGIAAGFAGGVLESLGDTASGIFYMAIHPVATYEGVKAMIVNWDDTLALVWQQGAEIIHNWPNMTAQEKANLAGQIAAEVALSLPARARQAGRFSEAAQDAVRLHMDKASRGLQIIQRTGVPLSPKAASELARRVDDIGFSSLDEIAEFLDKLDDNLPCRLVGGIRGRSQSTSATKPDCREDQVRDAFKYFDNFVPRSKFTPGERAGIIRGIVDAKFVRSGNTWVSSAGLRYLPHSEDVNTLFHMLRHRVDDVTKPVHGVFHGRLNDIPSLVDQAWRKVTGGSPDASPPIPDNHGEKKYIIKMGDSPIGHVGGSAVRNNPNKFHACYMMIVVRNGDSLVTAHPYRDSQRSCPAPYNVPRPPPPPPAS